METKEIEAVLERIWDLHDKISDAIHMISIAHFLKSIKNINRASQEKKQSHDGDLGSGGGEDGSCGYMFVMGFRANKDAALAKAKSLNATRTVLKNLEDQLEFFHVIDCKSQQSRLFPLLASAYAFRFVGEWLKFLYSDVTQILQARNFETFLEAHACTTGSKSPTTSVIAVATGQIASIGVVALSYVRNVF